MFASMNSYPQLFQRCPSFRGRYIIYIGLHLRMSFKISSYKNKSCIFFCRFNGKTNFFTCMNLENPDKLRKSSRKSSSKIASSIIKTLDED